MRQFLISFLFLFLVGSVISQTSPKTPSDKQQASTDDASREALVVEHLIVRVHYENDGTGFIEQTDSIRVVSEAGVQALGQLVFGYSSATEKLEVNYVRVKKPGGEVIETPAANAQDFAPEILRSAPMYSDFRQRHVTVSGLRPGDTLEYQTKNRIMTPLAAGEFWYQYTFPKNIPVTEARLEIDIPKSREVKLKSPRRKYTMADNGDRRVYTWVVENIAPDRSRKKDADEEEDEADDSDDQPEIQLTTFKDWQQIAQWYAKLQGDRVVVDDSIRKKATELTRGAATNQEKARRLYEFVAKDIRYVSLSFGIGRYQPHQAPEVLQGFYGDCKDKHTLLAALLQAVGIQSYPVLIGSDQKLDEGIPSPAQFDHVITAAQIDKDLTWLDATEEVAPFGMIAYALRDKQAVLAADGANGGLRRTPANSSVKDFTTLVLDGRFSEMGGLDATVDLTAQGERAMPFRLGLRRISQADWQKMGEILADIYGLRGDVSDMNVSALDEIEQPIHIRFKIHQDSYFTVPSTDQAFSLFPGMGFGRRLKKHSREPLDVGPIMEEHQKLHLQFPPNYTLTLPPDVKVARDYGEYFSSYRLANNVLDAERNLVIRVNQLPAMRRADVESLRSVIQNGAGQSLSCTIRPVAKTGEKTPVMAGASVQELHKAGVKALHEHDFQSASDLLKRVVDQEPQSKEAWDELGQAYLGLNNHPEALTAFQKQVEVNPFNKRAYDDLGSELRNAGKYDDAISAYSKQLDNSPLDREARKNRGLLLYQLKRDKDALPDLEQVASQPPEDPEIELALAQLYQVGNPEKSHSLVMNVIGSSAPVTNGDVYAAALRDDADANQAVTNATQIVNAIGDEFDEGVYGTDNPETFTAMHFLALEWARIGWGKFLKGQTLESIRFLNSAWNLSLSGTVANRLARVYQKAGQQDKANHMLALAVAAGGPEADKSRTQLQKLAGPKAQAEITQATAELAQLRSVKLPALDKKDGKAEFTLVFDGSSKPEVVEYHGGDASLAGATQALMDASYPVMFPDVSSAKIVRRGVLSCAASGCAVELKSLESVAAMPGLR